MERAAEEQVGRSRRIGIFGGTFDPPHNGHVSVVLDVAGALDLDEVFWVPARRSPHKPDAPLTEDDIRLEMVTAAVAGEARFRVRDLELRRPAPSFTVDTLREFRAEEPDGEFFLIIGVDQHQSFDEWRAPDEIRALATVVVMNRDGATAAAETLSQSVVRVDVGRVDISSTEVRRRVRAGIDVTDVVPPGVARVIESERLYSR